MATVGAVGLVRADRPATAEATIGREREWGKHDTSATPSECGTYRDDKVEMDLRDLDGHADDDTARSFGDRSLGGLVSVSSARETAYSDTPARSSFVGLLAARPRHISPERDLEVDLHRVYNCDGGVESVEAAIGTANLQTYSSTFSMVVDAG